MFWEVIPYIRPKSTSDTIFGSVILIYLQIQWPMRKQRCLMEDFFHVYQDEINNSFLKLQVLNFVNV